MGNHASNRPSGCFPRHWHNADAYQQSCTAANNTRIETSVAFNKERCRMQALRTAVTPHTAIRGLNAPFRTEEYLVVRHVNEPCLKPFHQHCSRKRIPKDETGRLGASVPWWRSEVLSGSCEDGPEAVAPRTAGRAKFRPTTITSAAAGQKGDHMDTRGIIAPSLLTSRTSCRMYSHARR